METIFTKIAKREIPAYIIDENDKYMAFLDINPSTYGQTLVIPKEQHDSYLFNNEDDFIQDFIIYVKKIGKLIDQKLGSDRCTIMFEGLEVNHLHAKLYPYFTEKSGNQGVNIRLKAEFNEEIANEIIKKIR